MKKRLFFILYFSFVILARDLKEEIFLNGKWLFTTGDMIEYANPDFDDSNWDEILVPGKWENNGYPGYDGFAWYRTTFYLPGEYENIDLAIQLGRIDDVDRVYINGHLIGGKGEFPPNYISAYNMIRIYNLPKKYINFNENNSLAIRVYDEEIEGGIVSGDIFIYPVFKSNSLGNLKGNWKFKTGNNLQWNEMNFDDSNWDEIQVPATWEPQGYPDYDGYAWYRKKIIINDDFKNEEYIFIIGKIDDVDEVYFNGVKIGKTGKFPREEYASYNQKYWNRNRIYSIHPELINWGKENTIAICVYDCGGFGGIYEGPVRLININKFEEEDWKDREISDVVSKFEDFFDNELEDVLENIIEFLDDIF